MELSAGQRLQYLDLIRGIAVLGLVLMNVTHMGMFELGYVQHVPPLLTDQVVTVLNALLFDGRFRSLFCLLFGIGLYLQYQSYQRQQLDPRQILKTRLNWLLCFGFIHCVFIWPGDILIFYALCGFVLLRYLDTSHQVLLRKGIWWFVLGIGIFLGEVALSAHFSEPVLRSSNDFTESYQTLMEPYWQYAGFNFAIALIYVFTFPLLSMFYLTGVMMIGLALFKSGKLQSGFETQQTRVLWSVTVLVSLIEVVTFLLVPQYSEYFVGVPGAIAGLTMALLIWHYVIVLKLAERSTFLIQALKRSGTLAFTLYIGQSIILVTLLRFLYPQWHLYFSLANYLALAILIIALQLVFAFAYKSRFKQGPLESLWRRLVARRIDKLNKSLADKIDQARGSHSA